MSVSGISRSLVLVGLMGLSAACGASKHSNTRPGEQGSRDGAVEEPPADGGGEERGGGVDGGDAVDGGHGMDDGGVDDALACHYPAALDPQVAKALDSGSTQTIANAAVLMDATLSVIEAQRTAFDRDLTSLFNLNPDGSTKSDGASLTALSWDPSHDAALLRASPGWNVEALTSNARTSGDDAPEARGLAVLGRTESARYLAFAANPFRTNTNSGGPIDAQLDQFLLNAMGWLAPRAAGAPLRTVIAQLDDSYWFKDESSTRAWLTSHYGASATFNMADQCDAALLAGCLEDKPDLLIISQALAETQKPEPIRAAVEQAMKAGVPVLYFNLDGDVNALGAQLLALLHVENTGDNYWENLKATKWNGAARLGQLSADLSAIRELVTRLASGAYDFSLADVAKAEGKLPVYQAQFGAGAAAVRSMMTGYDERAQNIFSGCGNELPKLLALLGDRLRQDVVYPMTVAGSTPQAFLRSYFADHAVYNARSISPAQPDRGNFDKKDLSKVSATTKTQELLSRRDFRSAGVYALPGRSMKVTRLDTEATKVWVFVNSLRSGATHEWDDSYFGYARPKYLQSAALPLEPGQTVVLTNPYGGPVQLRFDQSNLPVKLRFENVGEHPHWRGAADDASFASKLTSDTYAWVEVATNGFELHSRTDAFKKTMKDMRWSTPALLAGAIEQYTYNDVHVLAGFQGEGIDQLPEIAGWAKEHGLTVPVLDYVKHANMDQATCGNGCSGNPYDADWSFSPIAHGDVHELGHSLQNPRFQLSHKDQTYGNHAVTNWSPFYVASRYFEEHGAPTSEWSVEHKANFLELQKAYKAGDRAGSFSSYMNDYFANLISTKDNITNCYSFFMQAMLMARHKGMLQNGYHVVPRIHLLDRAVRDALKDADTWSAKRGALGFSSYSLEAAKGISNNDFIAVALSFVSGLDYRDFMDMWGIPVSAAAKAQIGSFGYPAVERAFFALGSVDHAHGALSTRVNDFQKLSIDPAAAWPTP